MFIFVRFQIIYDDSKYIIIVLLIRHTNYEFPNFWVVCMYFEIHESAELSIFTLSLPLLKFNKTALFPCPDIHYQHSASQFLPDLIIEKKWCLWHPFLRVPHERNRNSEYHILYILTWNKKSHSKVRNDSRRSKMAIFWLFNFPLL